MKIFSAEQIRKWDQYTMAEQHISSAELMEKAAMACTNWITELVPAKSHIYIFCGKGNNGGDGLAIARMLMDRGYRIAVYLSEHTGHESPDCTLNYQRLSERHIPVTHIRNKSDFPVIDKNDWVIDALFGTGLNKPLSGLAAELTEHINGYHALVISIDVPSGLFADKSSTGHMIIRADHTLCLQSYKRSFFFSENEQYTGQLHVLPIGLSAHFEETEPCTWRVTTHLDIKAIMRPRRQFAHKGDFGHAALVAGSYGMMGAAVLAAGACLQSGAGKLTCYVPACGYEIMQTARPEAMCLVTGDHQIDQIKLFTGIQALGIGPGLGQSEPVTKSLEHLLHETCPPLVLDADALNNIAGTPGLLQKIPAGSILTPHPKESDRLFGISRNDWDRLEKAIDQASQWQIYIILKGKYSRVIFPDGRVFFNSTGNVGMAKGGSGDVLTGLLTGLLAQGYGPGDAALIGTYIHGLAGDMASEKYSSRAMTAGNIIEFIGEAWKTLP